MHIIIKRGIAPIHLHTTVNTQHTHTRPAADRTKFRTNGQLPTRATLSPKQPHATCSPRQSSTNIKHADKIDLPSRDKTSFNLQRTIQTPPRKPGPSSRLNKQRAADAVGYLNPTPPRRPHKRGVPITGHASQSWSETKYFC